ncbi:hypothetical protein EVAR_87840_1 [Eumeta japonica]|uniref:Uncharacterized protein n=1 Tax=Eumeta variegata TaxID=151549 RepID=A0A4C1YI07_EUMVA|nr:hypothetical protein EVAR_87840_1 [Eumeta japonica]
MTASVLSTDIVYCLRANIVGSEPVQFRRAGNRKSSSRRSGRLPETRGLPASVASAYPSPLYERRGAGGAPFTALILFRVGRRDRLDGHASTVCRPPPAARFMDDVNYKASGSAPAGAVVPMTLLTLMASARGAFHGGHAPRRAPPPPASPGELLQPTTSASRLTRPICIARGAQYAGAGAGRGPKYEGFAGMRPDARPRGARAFLPPATLSSTPVHRRAA